MALSSDDVEDLHIELDESELDSEEVPMDVEIEQPDNSMMDASAAKKIFMCCISIFSLLL